VIGRIVELARELGATHSLGIGVPGLVDHSNGRITRSPNLALLEGFPLREHLATELGLNADRIHLENDACVAALGEFWMGGARDCSNVMMVTLGTGVGGGLILNGELFTGSTGLAAEIGHVVVDPTGPLCGCGNRGCLETLASAEAASRRCLAAGLPADLVEVAQLARSGDPTCSSLMHEVGQDLGRGLASALMLLDLEAFLIGGGFGAALDVLNTGILDGLLERSYGRSRAELRLLPAELGADAGWIGAAKLGSGTSSQ
jgi:glucokinase